MQEKMLPEFLENEQASLGVSHRILREFADFFAGTGSGGPCAQDHLAVFQYLRVPYPRGPFTVDEACELLAAGPRPLPARDRDFILEVSGRRPALLQKCYKVWLQAEEYRPDDWRERCRELVRTGSP